MSLINTRSRLRILATFNCFKSQNCFKNKLSSLHLKYDIHWSDVQSKEEQGWNILQVIFRLCFDLTWILLRMFGNVRAPALQAPPQNTPPDFLSCFMLCARAAARPSSRSAFVSALYFFLYTLCFAAKQEVRVNGEHCRKDERRRHN